MLSSHALGKVYCLIKEYFQPLQDSKSFGKITKCFFSEKISRVPMSMFGGFIRSNQKIIRDILILRKPAKYSRRI